MHPSQFNDLGVSYFANKQYHLAILAFTESLTQAIDVHPSQLSSGRAAIPSDNGQYNSMTNGQQNAVVYAARSDSFQHQANQQKNYSNQGSNLRFKVEEDDWVVQDTYCNEIIYIFSKLYDVSGCDSQAQCNIRCMFNLAVTHHRLGLLDNMPKYHLTQAARVYRLAHDHMMADDTRLTCPVMFMAILNNLGHIHLELGEWEHAHMYFENLLTTLLYTSMQGHGRSMNDDVQDYFFSNVTNMVLEPGQLAAAA